MPQPRKPARRAPARSVIEADPHLLADADTVEQVAQLVLQAAQKKNGVRILMIANQHEPDDAFPGAQPRFSDDGVTILVEDGKPVLPTYADQMADFQGHIDTLKKSFRDVWSRVELVLENRRKQLDKQEGQS